VCLAAARRRTVIDQVSAPIPALRGDGGCISDIAVSCLPVKVGRCARSARLRRAPPSTPQTETFLARSIRGLEWLGAAEIEADLNAFVLEVGHREIVFRAPVDSAVLKLGSIDDLFLLCGKIDEIDRGRISLPRLAKGLRKLPLVRSLAKIESLRPIRRFRGGKALGEAASLAEDRVYLPLFGTNPTYRGSLTMSVDQAKPEGAGPRSK
jgi:hypothetical protein